MARAVTLQLSLGKQPWLCVGDAVAVPLVVAAERLSAARAFIERFPAATKILIVAATRDAADDLARRITLMRARHSDFTASFVQLVVAGHGGHGAAWLRAFCLTGGHDTRP